MTIELDSMQTLLLALLSLLLGVKIKEKVYFFQRFCMPSPVIGGLLVSLLIWFLRTFGVHIELNLVLQDPLMVIFFTTIGLGGSYKILKTGGKTLVIYLFVCLFVVFYQNLLGAWLASLMGIHPVLGVMAGAVSLEGGHGAAAAFGMVAQKDGVALAETVAISAATFGLVAGSLFGGPVANFLIQRYRVPIVADQLDVPLHTDDQNTATPLDAHGLISALTLILVVMVVGVFLTKQLIAITGVAMPYYAGGMIIAIIFRNLHDLLKPTEGVQSARSFETVAEISLGIFLTMAMMSMKLWDLGSVILPIFVILMIQVVMLILVAILIAFPWLGKNYDAAVMCAGLVGHGLGATPNALANMSSVTEKYNLYSPKAFIIIPICGAVLVDGISFPWHAWLIQHLLH